jgi:hypothetical protein
MGNVGYNYNYPTPSGAHFCHSKSAKVHLSRCQWRKTNARFVTFTNLSDNCAPVNPTYHFLLEVNLHRHFSSKLKRFRLILYSVNKS